MILVAPRSADGSRLQPASGPTGPRLAVEKIEQRSRADLPFIVSHRPNASWKWKVSLQQRVISRPASAKSPGVGSRRAFEALPGFAILRPGSAIPAWGKPGRVDPIGPQAACKVGDRRSIIKQTLIRGARRISKLLRFAVPLRRGSVSTLVLRGAGSQRARAHSTSRRRRDNFDSGRANKVTRRRIGLRPGAGSR
jgi:hypothetical protein